MKIGRSIALRLAWLPAAALVVSACTAAVPSTATAPPLATLSPGAPSLVAPVPATPTKAPAATVILGMIGESSNIWPLYVAVDKGFLSRENVSLDIISSPASASSVQALIGGSINLSLATADAVIAGAAKGGGARIVGGFGRGAAVLVAKPTIKTIEQLRDKTIGASALQGGEIPLLRAMLGSKGLGADSYTVIVAGGPPARLAAMRSGSVDAVMLTPPTEQALVKDGFTNLGSSLQAMPDLAFVVLTVNADWAVKNPDVVVRTLRAFSAAMDWLLNPTNRAEANQILASRLKLSAEDAQATYNYGIAGPAPLYYAKLRISDTSLRNAINPLAEAGAITQAQADPGLYLDMSYLNRATP